MKLTRLTAALTIGCFSTAALALTPRVLGEGRNAGVAPARGAVIFVEDRGADAPEVKKEKGPYLGVSTSIPAQVLRRQLNLPNGVGLVADFIEVKGPADQAGLREYDVLNKLDDQILINQQQLAVLVRTYKPGDDVKLSIIRDGKPQSISVKLGEKELRPLEQMRLGDREQFDHLPGPFIQPVAPAGTNGERRLELRMNHPQQNLIASEMVFNLDDGKTLITLKKEGGHRHLLVKKKDGEVLFDGSIDTAEALKKLPQEILKKLESIPWLRDNDADDADRKAPREDDKKSAHEDEAQRPSKSAHPSDEKPE